TPVRLPVKEKFFGTGSVTYSRKTSHNVIFTKPNSDIMSFYSQRYTLCLRIYKFQSLTKNNKIMSLVKRNDVLFPSLMNEIFKPDWFGGIETLRASVPAVNIKENEKDYELELVVPGRKKDDFVVEVDKNILT